MMLPTVLKELIEEYMESIIIVPHPTALMFREITRLEWSDWHYSYIPVVCPPPPYRRRTTLWCGRCGNPSIDVPVEVVVHCFNWYCVCHA